MVIDLLVFVLHLQGNVEIDDFQAKVLVQEKIVGLDVPVSDAQPVQICEALDEPPTNSGGLAIKLFGSELDVIRDGVHFG
jgi:hypothetical protein